MTITEARQIIDRYIDKTVLTEDEEFLFLEALEYMITATRETRWMVELGGYHYGEKNYDLALKYYEMADELGDRWAAEGLGYIWYYGRTGEVDYAKAFRYYHKAMENGNLKSMVKVADMYRNGYGVERNEDMYVELIETAFTNVQGARFLEEPLPEVCTRLARIRTKQGRVEEAVELYLRAKVFLAQRIAHNPFFGNLNIMKWLEEDLYELVDFDPADFDLYDLYVLMKEPVRVAFGCCGAELEVESVRDGGAIGIRFDDRWYRDIDDFFAKATFGGERITTYYASMYAFSVVE